MELEKERRKFIRLSLEPPLQVKFKLSSSTLLGLIQEREASIKNISVGGGLLVELVLKSKEEEVKLLSGKEKIWFEAGIPGVNYPVKVLGRVAWLKKMDRADLFYEAGIAFEEINQKIQEDILHAMIDLAFKQKKY